MSFKDSWTRFALTKLSWGFFLQTMCTNKSFIISTFNTKKTLTFQTVDHASNLLDTALELSSSTRPQDCTTAAYLLRLLIKHYNLASPLKRTCDKYGVACDDKMLTPSGKYTISVLIHFKVNCKLFTHLAKTQCSANTSSELS